MNGYTIIPLGNGNAELMDTNVGCTSPNVICPTINIGCADVDVFCDADWGCECSGEDDYLCACGRSRPV